MIILKNAQVSLAFSEFSGALLQLTDISRDITYISNEESKYTPLSGFSSVAPFRIDLGSGLHCIFKEFLGYTTLEDINNGIQLSWQVDEGIVLTAQIRLLEEVQFNFQLVNQSSKTVNAVEYPIFTGLQRISGQGRDFLAHPYATGLLLKDPIINLNFEGDGLRYMPYPESFSGCSMQFFTYYGQGKGGLYFAAYDDAFHLKWLNFYHKGWGLEATHILGSEDIHPGNSLHMDYPFVLNFTSGESWYEAAEIYRKWALKQSWCAKGRLVDLPDNEKAGWLLEKVGVCTFGMNAMHDRTTWLKQYHLDIGTPIFHVLGPDWTKLPQTFGYGVPGGYNDWFPTCFSKENMETIRSQGDYVAPFEFDFWVDLGKDDSDNIEKNLMKFPEGAMSFDDYHFKIHCPYTQYTKDLHRRRDVQILRESNVDSMYYDVSSNNLMMSCLSENHGHTIGGSQSITNGFKTIYQDTKKALIDETSKYIPLGAELMNEIFIHEMDYYQARSWALPSSSLEFWPIRSLFLYGAAEVIPLLSYVYSGYGPLRMDGWGKLVEETGELFYSIVAKVYLWGGIYEINHEYSSMEVINGKTNCPKEHYYHFESRDYEYSSRRALYLRQFAAFRTGVANHYLAYGTMLPPPQSDAQIVEMEYYHYNHMIPDASYDTHGKVAVSSVFMSAWSSADDSTRAVMLANITSQEQSVTVTIDSQRYNMQGNWRATLYYSFDPDSSPISRELDTISSASEIFITLTLSARSPYMIKFIQK